MFGIKALRAEIVALREKNAALEVKVLVAEQAARDAGDALRRVVTLEARFDKYDGTVNQVLGLVQLISPGSNRLGLPG